MSCVQVLVKRLLVNVLRREISLTDILDDLLCRVNNLRPSGVGYCQVEKVSVVVSGSPSYFLAGDTSYNQKLLLEGKVDGVSPDMGVAQDTVRRIVALAEERPLVYLPAHDPEGAGRLARGILLKES